MTVIAMRRMPVGPARDQIALLVGATRGGTWIGPHTLVDRMGLPYAVATARLSALVDMGLAEWREVGGVVEYRAILPQALDALGQPY